MIGLPTEVWGAIFLLSDDCASTESLATVRSVCCDIPEWNSLLWTVLVVQHPRHFRRSDEVNTWLVNSTKYLINVIIDVPPDVKHVCPLAKSMCKHVRRLRTFDLRAETN